jgi:NAD(P)-dependent dehydrogenase (short-subunit alcohol dehydrogenase family)
MREFVGKAAFVTGGASGIGLALGRVFAEAGCKVMLADIEKNAQDAGLTRFSGSGREIRGIVCDVADPASVDAAAEATFSAFGKVHILCNNAGVGAPGGIDHIALDNWRWVLDVNLIGVVNGVRAFLPHMRAHDEGGHMSTPRRWLGCSIRVRASRPIRRPSMPSSACPRGSPWK